jgi:hypothetical protein
MAAVGSASDSTLIVPTGGSGEAPSSTQPSELEAWQKRASQTLSERVFSAFNSKLSILSGGAAAGAATLHFMQPRTFGWGLIKGYLAVSAAYVALLFQAQAESDRARRQKGVYELLCQFDQEEREWRKKMPTPSEGKTFSAKDLPKIAAFFHLQSPYTYKYYSLKDTQSDLGAEGIESAHAFGRSNEQAHTQMSSFISRFRSDAAYLEGSDTMLLAAILHSAAKLTSGKEKEFFEKAIREYLGEILRAYKERLAQQFSAFVSFAEQARKQCLYPSSEKAPTLDFHPIDRKTFVQEIWEKLKEKADDEETRQKLDALFEGFASPKK